MALPLSEADRQALAAYQKKQAEDGKGPAANDGKSTQDPLPEGFHAASSEERSTLVLIPTLTLTQL